MKIPTAPDPGQRMTAEAGTNQAWGQTWLASLEASPGYSDKDLERGKTYASHDWQLEVDVLPGAAEATARSGPRIRNQARVEAPTLTEDEWRTIVNLIAKTSTRTAALLERELDASILLEAEAEGVRLLPDPESLSATCSCRNWGELCKHAAAVIYLLAGVFDSAPLDLLLWRGLPYDLLVERVRHARRADGDDNSPDDAVERSDGGPSNGDDSEAPIRHARETIDATSSWGRELGPLPAPVPVTATLVEVKDYPSDAPPNAPFTGAGLHSLVVDAVYRSFQQLHNQSDAQLDLTVEADLGRRAALVESTGRSSRLSNHSGRPSRELAAKANAWRVAGAAGVEITQTSTDVLQINKFVQFRKNASDLWFRFEKISGRWRLVSGPATDPADLPETEFQQPIDGSTA